MQGQKGFVLGRDDGLGGESHHHHPQGRRDARASKGPQAVSVVGQLARPRYTAVGMRELRLAAVTSPYSVRGSVFASREDLTAMSSEPGPRCLLTQRQSAMRHDPLRLDQRAVIASSSVVSEVIRAQSKSTYNIQRAIQDPSHTSTHLNTRPVTRSSTDQLQQGHHGQIHIFCQPTHVLSKKEKRSRPAHVHIPPSSIAYLSIP